MKITRTEFRGRKAWQMDNGAITLTLLVGGGHIAGLELHERPGINPLWEPPWTSMEPWAYRAHHAQPFASRLLASIAGHNLCLAWFGDPSAEEARAGLECHGEAPVGRWRILQQNTDREAISLTCCCELPLAGMRITRTVSMGRDATTVHVREEVLNCTKRDLPFSMCEHVTFGPPFLKKGVTLFDMSASRGHTFPGSFGDRQRLKPDTEFAWPAGPGGKGEEVDMRTISRRYRTSSDFSTQLMRPDREDAWFSAMNPKLELLTAYMWKRADFPWLGNWEENYARRSPPWSGKTLARGMEFTCTPFPIGLRGAVSLGTFQDIPAFRWLPARGLHRIEYDILLQTVSRKARGVRDVRRKGGLLEVSLLEENKA